MIEITEKDVKNTLQLFVNVGILRKFWENGNWQYIDNRVPPSQHEMMQDKSLRNWVKPTEEECKEMIKKVMEMDNEKMKE